MPWLLVGDPLHVFRFRDPDGRIRAMAPVKISMRGLAEVASAKPSQKQSKLKKYQFPDSGESKGRSNYYVQATSAIKRHHRGQSDFVDSVLKELLIAASSEADRRMKAKYLNNHRAITDYLKIFGSRPLIMKSGKRLHYVYKDLVVSAHPDLVAEENGELILIKLNLGKEDFAGGVNSTLLHVLYEAAKKKGLPIKPSGVECLQTSSGSRTTGPEHGFPDQKVLNAACQELLSLWVAA
jgi:hypothetical protein